MLLSESLDISNEIISLMKYLPKWGDILGTVKENIEEDIASLANFHVTHWTVKAKCLKRILEN